MRSLVLAVVVALCAPSLAAAEYRLLPGPPVDAGFVLQGSNVLVGAAGVLTAHAPDGTTRVVPLPLTPLLPELDRIVFDGRRLAFGVGTCVFAGLIPAPGAPLPEVSPEGCVRS